MKTDERNKFAIKSFLGEYLDLRKDKIMNWQQLILSVKVWSSRGRTCGFLSLPFSWRHLA